MSARVITARWLALWFGCGLSPRAPGTVGSLGAVPVHLLLCTLSAPLHALGAVLLAGVGVWAADRCAAYYCEVDPQRVVIDEVAGTVIAMGLVRDHELWVQALALVAFRLLDIWKPWPIRRLEHLKPPGVGIMFDDLLAGLLAGALLRAIA